MPQDARCLTAEMYGREQVRCSAAIQLVCWSRSAVHVLVMKLALRRIIILTNRIGLFDFDSGKVTVRSKPSAVAVGWTRLDAQISGARVTR